jgi:hypothetical protein
MRPNANRLLSHVSLALLAVTHLSCNQSILTAPAGTTMTVIINPPTIPANGGVATVSAILVEPAGTPVADGTVVQFFTTLGRIDEQGKTNDGVARVNLVSDARSGEAGVSAFSGAVKADGKVRIGAILPTRIVVTANPTRLENRRAADITATVLDNDGNPVSNIGVVFTITAVTLAGTSTSVTPDEFMESNGAPVFTDNNGRARDVMRTRRDFSAQQFLVEVTAEVLGGAGSTSAKVTNKTTVLVN